MAELNVNRVIRRALSAQWDGCTPAQWGDFCVVDGARSPRIYEQATRAGEEWACLYEGRLPIELARTAPYLVRLHPNSHFTRRFYEEGWGNAWGIVIRSPTSLPATRRHLRTITYVRGSDRRKLLFRFYDPRVLRVFVPTCSRRQLAQLFGPLGAFVVEDEPSTQALTFVRDSEGRLVRRSEDLTAEAEPGSKPEPGDAS